VKARLSKDHFVKVRNLIKDMVARLGQDAEDEATQKGVCDENIKKNVDVRDKENQDIEDSTGKLSKASADKERLSAENVVKSSDIAKTTKAKQELTKLNKIEIDNLVATKVAATIGQQSIQFAIQTLTCIFNPGAAECQVPSFLQTSESHLARQKLASTILDNLQTIESSFQQKIDTSGDTIDSTKTEFDEQIEEYDATIQSLEGKVKENEGSIATLKDDITNAKDELNSSMTEKEEAVSLLEALKAQCVDGEETFEERSAKAKEEIEALKEAYNLLDSWDQ